MLATGATMESIVRQWRAMLSIVSIVGIVASNARRYGVSAILTDEQCLKWRAMLYATVSPAN